MQVLTKIKNPTRTSNKLYCLNNISGGLELSNTGYARIAEVTALDSSIALSLSVHQATGLKVRKSLFRVCKPPASPPLPFSPPPTPQICSQGLFLNLIKC